MSCLVFLQEQFVWDTQLPLCGAAGSGWTCPLSRGGLQASASPPAGRV